MQPALSDKSRTQYLRYYPCCCMDTRTSEFRHSVTHREGRNSRDSFCLLPHDATQFSPKPEQSNIAVGGSALSVLGGKIISHNQSAETSDAAIQWRWLLACVTTNPPISQIGGLTAHHYLCTTYLQGDSPIAILVPACKSPLYLRSCTTSFLVSSSPCHCQRDDDSLQNLDLCRLRAESGGSLPQSEFFHPPPTSDPFLFLPE